MQVFLGSYLPLYIFLKSNVCHKKDAVGANQQKNRLRLSPISGGFRRLRSAAYRAMRVSAAYTIVTLHNIPKLLIKCAAVGEKR